MSFKLILLNKGVNQFAVTAKVLFTNAFIFVITIKRIIIVALWTLY